MNSIKILRAVVLLWCGAIGAAGLAFLTQVVLARALSPQDFGALSAAFSVVSILAPVAGFGLANCWLQVFGREGWGALRWLQSSFVFLRFSIAIAYVLLGLWLLTSSGEHLEYKVILGILSFQIVGQAYFEIVTSKFQLEERYAAASIWQSTPQLVRFCFVYLSFIFGLTSLLHYSVCYALSSFIVLVLAKQSLRDMRSGNLRLKGHGAKQRDVVTPEKISLGYIYSASWPFGFAGLFYLCFSQSPIVILERLLGAKEAGFFNVAFLIISAVYILPSIIYQRYLMPKLHRWAMHDRSKFRKVFKLGNAMMLLVGILFMILVWFSAEFVTMIAFGSDYSESATFLKVYSLAIPGRFLSTSVGAVLVTQDHMRRKVILMGLSAACSIVAGILMVKSYGAIGAVFSAIVSEYILLLIYLWASKKYVFVN